VLRICSLSNLVGDNSGERRGCRREGGASAIPFELGADTNQASLAGWHGMRRAHAVWLGKSRGNAGRVTTVWSPASRISGTVFPANPRSWRGRWRLLVARLHHCCSGRRRSIFEEWASWESSGLERDREMFLNQRRVEVFSDHKPHSRTTRPLSTSRTRASRVAAAPP